MEKTEKQYILFFYLYWIHGSGIELTKARYPSLELTNFSEPIDQSAVIVIEGNRLGSIE
jgi:hypothetical protein